MRKSSDQPQWRCVAVTRDGRNTNRLRIIAPRHMGLWWCTSLKTTMPSDYYRNTTFSSQVNRHIRMYSSRSLDRNNAITAKGSVTMHSRAARIEYVQDAPPRATITVSARHRYPSALSAAVRISHSVEIA
ncbi:hypothetical protein HZ326_25754 [Fusarium oxysporum f. sp. albedinis]|nr:hypothetical protein HZ326_25754 [Fusarium oxysporum f. sp. albedinis]